MKHIAIIGGGFTGTMTGVNLARLAESPVQVTVINHGSPTGRGVAYSTTRPEHLLNVAARNMSALPEHPNHFVEWLRTRTEFAELPEAELRETFFPRRIYGDYLRSLALHYTQPLDRRGPVEFRFVDDEGVDVAPEGRGARITLASGRTIDADNVVLATGNEAPAELPGSESLSAHPGYVANPWQSWSARLPDPADTIVLLGTGLTTIDAIITLLSLGWAGKIHAVSRHGWFPHSHFRGSSHPEFPPANLDLEALGLERLAELIEDQCARLRKAGENPAIVVDRLRPHTQRIWQAFSVAERKTFVSRYAARWNVMRHRIAPSLHQAVMAAVEDGRLQVTPASIARLTAHGPQIHVHLTKSGPDATDTPLSPLAAALVINCTGPQTRFSATRSRLLQAALSRGLVRPDAVDMGIQITDDFATVQRDGSASPFLYALGPLLRGTFWESIAVPELRGQTLHVAQSLLKGMARRVGPEWALEPAVVEYWI